MTVINTSPENFPKLSLDKIEELNFITSRKFTSSQSVSVSDKSMEKIFSDSLYINNGKYWDFDNNERDYVETINSPFNPLIKVPNVVVTSIFDSDNTNKMKRTTFYINFNHSIQFLLTENGQLQINPKYHVFIENIKPYYNEIVIVNPFYHSQNEKSNHKYISIIAKSDRHYKFRELYHKILDKTFFGYQRIVWLNQEFLGRTCVLHPDKTIGIDEYNNNFVNGGPIFFTENMFEGKDFVDNELQEELNKLFYEIYKHNDESNYLMEFVSKHTSNNNPSKHISWNLLANISYDTPSKNFNNTTENDSSTTGYNSPNNNEETEQETEEEIIGFNRITNKKRKVTTTINCDDEKENKINVQYVNENIDLDNYEENYNEEYLYLTRNKNYYGFHYKPHPVFPEVLYHQIMISIKNNEITYYCDKEEIFESIHLDFADTFLSPTFFYPNQLQHKLNNFFYNLHNNNYDDEFLNQPFEKGRFSTYFWLGYNIVGNNNNVHVEEESDNESIRSVGLVHRLRSNCISTRQHSSIHKNTSNNNRSSSNTFQNNNHSNYNDNCDDNVGVNGEDNGDDDREDDDDDDDDSDSDDDDDDDEDGQIIKDANKKSKERKSLVNEHVVNYLREKGIEDRLISISKGSQEFKKKKSAFQKILSISTLLEWYAKQSSNTQLDNNTNMSYLIGEFITKDFSKNLDNFLSFLTIKRGYRKKTQANSLKYIEKVVNLFIFMHKPNPNEVSSEFRRITVQEKQEFNEYFKDTIKVLQHASKIEGLIKNSLKSKIKDRKYPVNGLKSLQDEILPLVDPLIQQIKSKKWISQNEFANFLQHLWSCFYVTSCNGREQGNKK